jgi:hypothetical protein
MQAGQIKAKTGTFQMFPEKNTVKAAASRTSRSVRVNFFIVCTSLNEKTTGETRSFLKKEKYNGIQDKGRIPGIDHFIIDRCFAYKIGALRSINIHALPA